jgi:hypothetical protein
MRDLIAAAAASAARNSKPHQGACYLKHYLATKKAKEQKS